MSTTDGPYVGLDYFVEDDVRRFFGRDGERKRIIGNLRASRLTLLYAESGVGKTLLLRVGVSARIHELVVRSLAERGSACYVFVVFSSWRSDPTIGLIEAIENALWLLLGDDDELVLLRDALEDAIDCASKAVDATLLLILDQFEEHFFYASNGDDGFDDELVCCVNRRDLWANFLISVCEDAYSQIGPRFKACILDVYGNFLHLDFFDEFAAREVVVEPIRAFNDGLEAGVL